MNTIIQTTHSDMCKVKNKQLSEFKHQYSARFGRIGKLIRMGKLEKRYAMHLPVLGFLGCLICHKKVNNMQDFYGVQNSSGIYIQSFLCMLNGNDVQSQLLNCDFIP